tara:strand:+ start:789 stop:1259 length:471 start_codon:yes stop_codon:yes gene_type:complete
MAAEILAAVQICASSYRLIKAAVHEGREITDLSKTISKFWDAREQVSVLEQKATNQSNIEKLFGGKSIESQALEITLQKQKAIQLEKDLKELFYWTGNGNLWQDMIRERARLRNMRIYEAKAKAEARANTIDAVIVLMFLMFSGLVVVGITSVVMK